MGINANVGLHAEVPLIALFTLVHLRVALAFFVLRRRRGRDQCGIDNCTFSQQESFGRKMVRNGVEYRLGQLVLFQQVTEVQQGCRIRRTFS